MKLNSIKKVIFVDYSRHTLINIIFTFFILITNSLFIISCSSNYIKLDDYTNTDYLWGINYDNVNSWLMYGIENSDIILLTIECKKNSGEFILYTTYYHPEINNKNYYNKISYNNKKLKLHADGSEVIDIINYLTSKTNNISLLEIIKHDFIIENNEYSAKITRVNENYLAEFSKFCEKSK